MAQVEVTVKLAETIRRMRLENKQKAKDLAVLLGKSSAYITKLEKREILNVSEKDFATILSFLTEEKPSDEKMIEKVYEALRKNYSDEEIDDQIWFVNYDTIERKIPVPPLLVDEINEKMAANKITREYLLERVNANESLSEKENLSSNTPVNVWYAPNRRANETEEAQGRQKIKIDMDIELMSGVLDKKIDSINYTYMLALVFYLLKIELYADRKSTSYEQDVALMSQATDLLDRHQFYSTISKNRQMTNAAYKEENLQLLDEFDRENIKVVNDILKKIRLASKSDSRRANSCLISFSENLDWDLGFMLKVVEMEFNLLEDLSYSNKKQLLEKIEKLIAEYKYLPDEQKLIEHY